MSSNNSDKSKSLLKIAEKLRLYQSNHGSSDLITTKGSKIHRNIAAVLICLFEGKYGDLRVILTQRSSTMSTHSGEVALPGGKWEEGDESFAATALREAEEEIGLDPSVVEVVALLHPIHGKNERRREKWVESKGYGYLLHFFDYETEKRSYTIWAFTAAVLIKTASIIYERPPAFEEHLPIFWKRSRH